MHLTCRLIPVLLILSRIDCAILNVQMPLLITLITIQLLLYTSNKARS